MSLDILGIYDLTTLYLYRLQILNPFTISENPFDHSFYINVFSDPTSTISLPKVKVKYIIRFRIRYVFVPTLKLKLLHKLNQRLKYVNTSHFV